MKALPAIPRASFEETLGRHVLPSRCVGCGTCVVVCPINCLEYLDGRPVLIKECKSCGICSQTCPQYGPTVSTLERFIFGRERKVDEDFGIYRRLLIAQSKDKDVMRTCQDGGIVTTLLVYALEKGIVEGAIVSGVSEKEPLRAVPKLATTRDGIIECAGTRYTYSPNIFAFKEVIKQKKKSLAFVGTPDQIIAVRKIQMLPLKKLSDALSFMVGVFCSECFLYEGFVKKLIQGQLGVDPYAVKKVNIKGKLLITMNSGDVRTIPLKDAKRYTSDCASSCSDFAAELADISVGGLGLDGWTFTVLRTEKGEELFSKAESEGLIRTRLIDKEKKALDLLIMLSRKKRKNVAIMPT